MQKFRCIIADDEPLAVRLLASYVKRCANLELVGSFTSAADALHTLRSEEIDIAFLDIQMPQLSGLEIARVISDKPVTIIFVTAFRDYAFEGFQVHAMDYLLKPVSFEEFTSAVDRATHMLVQDSKVEVESKNNYLTVRSDYRLVRIEFSDILYIEGLKDYVKIYVEGQQRPIITLMSLKSIEQELPESGFMRIHRSFIVSLHHISSFDRANACIAGTSIPVGHTYRSRFIERLS